LLRNRDVCSVHSPCHYPKLPPSRCVRAVSRPWALACASALQMNSAVDVRQTWRSKPNEAGNAVKVCPTLLLSYLKLEQAALAAGYRHSQSFSSPHHGFNLRQSTAPTSTATSARSEKRVSRRLRETSPLNCPRVAASGVPRDELWVSSPLNAYV
jgi:hypothetical protein